MWLPGHSRGSLSADRIVSLPLARGPRLPGVPATGPYGLIPVDPYGRVDGLPDAYAIGDATDFPLKQGGIACQQADAVAANIAARHGADVAPTRFEPVLRATLLTGDGPPISLGAASEGIHAATLPGRFLAPYLQSHAEARDGGGGSQESGSVGDRPETPPRRRDAGPAASRCVQFDDLEPSWRPAVWAEAR